MFKVKRFFSTSVALGVGLSTLAGISEAQYFGSPTGNGLYSNPPFATHPGVPIRQVAAPLRIGGNYPHVAQQGIGLPNGVGAVMGHQHIPMPGSGLSSPKSVMEQPQSFGNPTLAPKQSIQLGAIQSGPMTTTPSYTAPLPPVNNDAIHHAGAETIQPKPMTSSQSNGAPYAGQPMQQAPHAQQNFEQYPSTHASTYGSYGTAPAAGLYQGPDGSSCSTCSADGSCVTSLSVNPYLSGPVAVSPWIFGANALIFQRIDNDSVRLSTNGNDPRPPYLTTYDARMETAGGYELMGGRYFGCGQYAILGSYWSILPTDETRTVYGGGTTGVSLYTNLPFNFTPGAGTAPYGITMPGNDAYFWYNDAQAHQITRGSEFQNVEVNFFSFALGGAARQGFAGAGGFGGGFGVGAGGGWKNGRFGRSGFSRIGRHDGHGHGSGGGQSCGNGGCNECAQPSCAMPCSGPTNACGPIVGAQCSPLRFAWFGGVRWFQFSDNLQYATSQDDAIIGNGTDFFYRNNVVNDLVGFQLGGLANYCCGSRLSLYAGTKFGVFNNRTQFDTFAGNSTAAATVQNGSYAGQAYNLMTTENNVAFLGEGEVGGRVRVTNGWSATCGYRLLGVAGVATAPGQIPYDFSRLDDASDIKTNDSLLLHGITIGALYNW
jgi:hypothetical protein